MKGLDVLKLLLLPVSRSEDARRRELVLNVLLLGSMALAMAATVDNTFDAIWHGSDYRGVAPGRIFVFFLVFLMLYLMSRARFGLEASYVLVGIYFFAATYVVYAWGVDLPQGLLTYVLVIVMAGILISTRAADPPALLGTQ